MRRADDDGGSAIAPRDAGCRPPSSTRLDAAARDQHGGIEGSAYGLTRRPAVDDAGSVVADHNGGVGALEVPLEPIHHRRARDQKAMRSGRARVGRVASFLHFLCDPSGHASTVSRCATGSNP
jgi:hypothetical protein